MKAIVLSFILLVLIISAYAQTFPENVGDIPFDSLQDDPSFVVCNPKQVFQYYNTGSYYKDHKKEIIKYLLDNFRTEDSFNDQNGFLTVRFIINCNGHTGRFRLLEIDNDYQPIHFREALSQQLLSLVKQVRGWQPAVYKEKVYDSYQYITFRIRNGKIISISP
ncbi:hypothetical protein [Chitinophaga tropicalis]|uniref:TonB C-terminal domain-containing protein n=1 Tax=Chitinophaga tropicalis TaxID=2683588 RepID=A0A7K1U222_9BACT|nr:hypothetical protein [Chitinophaga tropicalis]MVT08393.1 hypothetical protein [Chitinophaga tropicalis]